MGRRKAITITGLIGLTLLNIIIARYVIWPLKERERELLNRGKSPGSPGSHKAPKVVVLEDIHPIHHLQDAAGVPRQDLEQIMKNAPPINPQPNAETEAKPNPNQPSVAKPEISAEAAPHTDTRSRHMAAPDNEGAGAGFGVGDPDWNVIDPRSPDSNQQVQESIQTNQLSPIDQEANQILPSDQGGNQPVNLYSNNNNMYNGEGQPAGDPEGLDGPILRDLSVEPQPPQPAAFDNSQSVLYDNVGAVHDL